MMVDDDKFWLRPLSGFFKVFGYTTLTASTCEEGFRLAKLNKPACVLLDFHLPDADADVFCSRVRADPDLKRTPIIIVSADAEQECGSHLNCEADGFVLKGGQLNTIRLMVESLLRRVEWERGILEKGDLRLETEKLRVSNGPGPGTTLSREQFRFLFILMERSPAFVPEDDALKFVFGTGTPPEKFDALRGLAARLRAKLGPRIGKRIKSKTSQGWIYLQPGGTGRRAPKTRRTGKEPLS